MQLDDMQFKQIKPINYQFKVDNTRRVEICKNVFKNCSRVFL